MGAKVLEHVEHVCKDALYGNTSAPVAMHLFFYWLPASPGQKRVGHYDGLTSCVSALEFIDPQNPLGIRRDYIGNPMNEWSVRFDVCINTCLGSVGGEGGEGQLFLYGFIQLCLSHSTRNPITLVVILSWCSSVWFCLQVFCDCPFCWTGCVSRHIHCPKNHIIFGIVRQAGNVSLFRSVLSCVSL